MPVYEVRKGAESYGHAVGILSLEHPMPFIPGSVGNMSTYSYPVILKMVKGLAFERVFRGDPECGDMLIEAAQELEAQGVKAITSNCGFMIKYQDKVAQSVKVPVFMSSLLQLPLIAASSGKTRPIGMITADDRGMGNDMLILAGIDADVPVVVKGMQDRPEFKRSTLEMCGTLDSDQVEQETVEVACEMLDEHPNLAAILLECSELPPFAKAIQEATGLPTYDFITMIDYFHAATHRERYEGYY
jgi:aspartate/glutamate racemase